MRTYFPFGPRPLIPGLLSLSLLALAACGHQASKDDPMDGRSVGSDAGEGTPLPDLDERNRGEAGSVTKPTPSQDDAPQSFESDLKGSPSSSGGGIDFGGLLPPRGLSGNGAPGGMFTSAGTAADGISRPAAEAERAIIEADIVQVSGNTLYALSEHAGLSVIDIANPSAMRLLGRFRELHGKPFELYLQGSVAVVMFSSWGQYEKQADDGYKWIQTSKVVALDATDPTAIASIGTFDIPGEVSDSRVVGHIMYVVGYQNGVCWNCPVNQPLTAVLSLDIADPHAIRRVDALELLGSNTSYGGGKRSISVTTQRIYIAGPEYGQSQPTGSTLQVVDISSPSGELVEGATLQLAGQIQSRWQIDEYQGVLRVVSQPFPWTRAQSNAPPSVQTFTVTSSQQISALGGTDLRIPENETLRSARFDGPRAYAITARQTDPLFTIDLSDPAQPRQVGELEMPGWIYHMEPRGERVVGLGYDQNNPAGGITVSIFDVSNLAMPRMLSRVNFGGTWASLPEDQDRIHKAFKVLDREGLILVPFSGWSDTARGAARCVGAYRSGIQLIDFRGDTLGARGMAPSRGVARRAIPLDSTLLAVSDEAVDAFDITNRQSPRELGHLTIAENVTSALPLGNGHVARIVQDWYGMQRSSIEIVPLAGADRPDLALSQLDLSKILEPESACAGNAYIQRAFVSGNEIDLVVQRYASSSILGTITRGVITVDASDPSAPKLMGKLEWSEERLIENVPQDSPWSEFYNYYVYGSSSGARENTVRTKNTLVRLEQRWINIGSGFLGASNVELRINVIDLRDPAHPTQATLALPKASGYAGLVVDGDDVLFSHFDQIEATARGRFYINRLDLSDPREPKLTDKISVPGSLLHHDAANARALTSELSRTVVKDLTNRECNERFGYAEWVSASTAAGITFPVDETVKGTCTGYLQHLHLVRYVGAGAVLDSSYHLGEAERLSGSSLGDSRVTAVLNHGTDYFIGGLSLLGALGRGGASPSRPAEVVVLGGLDTGSLEVGRLSYTSRANNWWGWYGTPTVYATGTSALVQSASDVAILDTSVPSEPKLVRTVPLFGASSALQAVDTLVLLALGMNGVQHIDL